MSRKDRDDSIWLTEHSDKRRIRDAEKARRNRAEITAALSHGQIRRRDLVKWGLFTSAGLMLPIGGLNPFVRPLRGQALSPSAVLAGQSDNQGIPTGLPASPTFGVKPFTQPMPRFDVLPRNAVSTLTPAPQAQSNQTQQVLDPGFGFPAGTTGPIEGRPPGKNWAHQRFAQFPHQLAIEVTTKPVTTNTTYNPAVTSDLNSGINPASPIPAKFHPSFPTQNANRVWTFQGTFPPKLTQVRVWRTGPVPPSQSVDY
jgi:manganese oxidase